MVMQYCVHIILAVILITKAQIGDYPPLSPVNNTNFGRSISRTMHLLASSTPQHRNTVKILVYGQSITRGSYWLLLKSYLQQTFPHADLIMENLAIGGFAVPKLLLPAEHDVFPLYPDLIIFHVYGPEPDYEDLMREFRKRTTAEIAIQTDHVTPNDGPAWEEHHSFQWLPSICETYGIECLDVRRPWQKYLDQYKIEPGKLLLDGTHPNVWGNWLMASIIQPYLRYDPKFAIDPYNLSTSFIVGKDVKWENGKIQMQINGNRVDLIALNPTKPGANSAKILIDGQPPSNISSCYTFTRPNFETADTTSNWPWDIGSAIRIDHYAPLIEEDWVLTFTSVDSNGTYFTYSLEGSKTGFDGTGNSSEYFVSKSARVMIQPDYWFISEAFVKYKPGFQVKWKSILMGTNIYNVPQVTDPTRDYATTVAQGLANQYHTLEIIANNPQDGDLPISEIRVYRPPLGHW